ncbi:lipoprotein [Thioclava atlantica]|uniref:Lipoprotein n=2 Tax=Thioclava atlantica TaxID=1317124 RepID=A0A085TRC0_9RHOB|nr:lipoprotein [Thioclava atlantica]
MRGAYVAAAILGLAGCANLSSVTGKKFVPVAAGQGVAIEVVQSPQVGLEVVIPSRDVSAVLLPAGRNGTVTTWRSQDNVTVAEDRGVVVATRGLGDDLMAADAGPTLAALSGSRTGAYRRTFRFLDAEEHARYVLMGCTISRIGPETLAGRDLIRHEETCKAHNFGVKNIYWTDEARAVRAARQWISPKVGMIAIGLSNAR